MKLEQQVCSLELAKRLKELGEKQESLWYWEETTTTAYIAQAYVYFKNFGLDAFKYYSAFTVAECLRLLNEEVIIPKDIENVANFLAEKLIIKID